VRKNRGKEGLGRGGEKEKFDFTAEKKVEGRHMLSSIIGEDYHWRGRGFRMNDMRQKMET